MKLHLPSLLRKALLSCMAAVASVTFASGSAWADTYDLLASDANWTLGADYSYADGSISKSSSWGGIKASVYSMGTSYYTVKADNTLTFTIGFTSATDASAQNTSASNSVLTFAWTGGDDAVVMGADNYPVTAYRYGTATDAAAASYGGSDMGLTPFAADGSDMTRAWGVNYTLQGTVTLADGNYTLEMTLNDGTNTYTSSTIDLGDSFWLDRFVMSSAGGADTLTQLEIDGLYVERAIYTTTLTGQVDASAATWQKDGVAVNYSDIPLTGGEIVLAVAGGEDGGVLAVSGAWDVHTLSVSSGTVALKLENGANLTALTVSGFGGIQMDDGEKATFSGGTISLAGSILTSGSTAELTLANAELNLNSDQDLYGTVCITGNTTLTGAGRLIIKDGGTILLSDGASFTRSGTVAYWLQGSIETMENANATFTASNDIHFDYKESNTASATGRIVVAQGSTLNLNVGSESQSACLIGYDDAVIEVESRAVVNYSGGLRGTLKFAGPGSMNFSDLAFGDRSGNTGPMTTATFTEGIQVTAERLCNANGSPTINVEDGAGVTITGSNNTNSNAASFLLAHWGHAASLNVNGGMLTSQNAIMRMSLDGKGAMSITNNGVATLKGITFLARNSVKKGSLVLGSAEGADATLKIGDAGIQDVTGEDVTVSLGNGTIEATADWEMTGSGTVELVGATGTTFNTAAYTVKIAPTLSGTGKLIKTGTGTLEINAAATLADVNIKEGFVQAGAALTLTALTVSEGAGFAYDIAGMSEETDAAITAAGYSGALTIKLVGASAGTYKLANVSNALLADDVTFVGLSDRIQASATVSADGLLSVTLDAGVAMDLTWDVDGPGNVWASSGDANWDAAGSDVVFVNGDNVTFAGTDADGAVTISGAVAPNNVTVSGTGYVFEGGSIAATGKLTVAENADLHLKSQASFAGGVEVGGNLTITDNYTTGNTQSLLGTISGVGNVDLYLGSTAIGFDFSGMTGGTISVKTGRLEANTSAFSSTSATLPSIELANSTFFVFNANQTVANEFSIADNANATFLVNRGDDRGAVISGNVNGGAGSTLTVLTNPQLLLQGSVAVEKLHMRGKLALGDGANVVVSNQLRMGEQGSAELTIDDGARLTIQGSTNSLTNEHSFLVSHYGYNTSLILNGGELHSQNAMMRISFDNNGEDANEANEPVQGTFRANDGLANLYGMTFKDKWSAYKGKFLLGVEGNGSPVINIGAGGIEGVNAADANRRGVTVTLGNGTLGATADWEMTGNGTVNLVGTTGTTFNTAAYTVKIAPTLSGTGKLIKTGTGTLEINAAATLADVNIKEGFVQAGAALTLTALAVADGAGFAYDLSTTPALITAAGYNGKLTLNLSNVAEGNYDLFQGAADIQKDSISLIDAETGAAIVSGGRRTADINVSETGLVQLTVALSNLQDLSWEVADTDNQWSVGTGTNWASTAEGADQQFYNGDSVTFAGTGEEITIVGTVQPAAITVTGTGYSLVGDGSIGGSGKLTVATGGEITIGTANTYTGGTEIAAGGKLTMTHNQALGGSNGAPGAITGAGTLVVNVGSGNFVYATGENAASNLGGFTGTVDIESGKLQIGSTETSGGSLKGTQFGAAKVIVRNGAALNTHFGADGGIATASRATFASALDMMAGSTLYNIDGHVQYTGAVRFNIVDPAAATASYDAAGVVRMDQFYTKNMDFTGKISGDGTVEFCNPSNEEGKAVYRITGADNDFCGIYKIVDCVADAKKYVELRLGSQTAAQYADINLASTASTGYLMLDSDATINGLYGGGAVQAQDGNRTLTVTEGDYSGGMMNSDANVLSLTKQGAADTTLVLRGDNTYTGATTINGGTLELAAGATMAREEATTAADMTAITVNELGTLKVNAGAYTNTIKGTGTIYKDTAAASTLSGVGAEFTGRIYVADGSLNVGAALEISGDRTLSSLMKNAATLTSALTLGNGTLELDYVDAAADSALSLGNSALTLAGGTKLSLLNVGSQGDMLTLLAGVSSLQNADGSELVLSDANNALSNYFDVAGTDLADSTLALNNGLLQISLAKYLTWDPALDTWQTDEQFGDEAADIFTTDADVKFGALTADEESVTIDGQISVGKVLIDAGEGKTYDFIGTGSIVSAESITVDSGTAAFGAGTLGMPADAPTTLTVNDGATLSLANGAITNAGAVSLELNDGSTLQWQSGNTTDYSGVMTVANGAEITLVNSSGNKVALTAGSLNADTESATVNLSGGIFQMDAVSVYGNVSIGSGINVELMSSAVAFTQNFSGDGGINIVGDQGVRRLSGTNTYAGDTALNGRLIIQGAQALSEYTTFTGTSDLYLSKAANAETAEYTVNRTLNSAASTLYVGIDDAQNDPEIGGPVTGITLNLGADAEINGNIYVRNGNKMDVAVGATIAGLIHVRPTAELTLHEGIGNQIQGGGTVKIDGDFTWDATGKTYTGETQVLAGSTLTAGAPLTTGAGKVQLLADTTANTVGTLVITNSDNWANKVYGAGTLVLVDTEVDNMDAIIDHTAADTLARLEIGKAAATRLTQGVNGRVDIDTANEAAAMAKVDTVVVNAGSVLTNNVPGTAAAPIYLGQNLVLSGAGDAAGSGAWLQAALSLHDTTGKKYLASHVTLAADATIYVGNADAVLSGDFDSNGHMLTKTGDTKLELNSSNIDLSGGVDIQNGSLEVNYTADTALAVGAVNLASGSSLQLNGESELSGAVTMNNNAKLQFKGQSELTGGLDVVSGSVQLIVNIVGDNTAVSEVDIASAVTGANDSTIILNHTAPTNPANGSGVLTLRAANDFAGTWTLNTANWQLQLAHADAAQYATLNYVTATSLKLMDGEGLTTYNVKALKSSVTGASIATEGDTRHTLNITNTLTAVADATYQGSVAGTVDVVLAGGAQKLSGALGDGSTYKVSGGTLAIASTNQSGSHSFTAAGGVLDMGGYTRAAVSAMADEDDGIWNQAAPSVADTIYAVGGQVQNLNLGAGMLLTDVLPDTTVDTSAAAMLSQVLLGGANTIGAGSLAFRVKDSANIIEGTEDNTPYRLTNTQYAAAEGGSLSLAAIDGRGKTYLQVSLLDALDVLDPTPAENSGANYRDHVLISGMAVADTLSLSNGSADASGYFATNLSNAGSTKYELLFVEKDGLYDLVLRASGKADTLFWGNAAGGTWSDAAGADDWKLGAKDAQGAWQPTADAADFEQFDNVIFGDLTDAAGTAVTSVTVTAGSVSSEDENGATIADTVRFGSMLVDADTTNYTIVGSISGMQGNTGATLTKTGAATLTLTGANSYAGDTYLGLANVNGGTLVAQHDAALSNTMIDQRYGKLVLDFQNADTDGVLDALLLMRGGNTLAAKTDAKVRYASDGGAKTFEVSTGKTLTLVPTNTDGTAGTAVEGTLQVNISDAPAGDAMDGIVELELLANTAYTSSNSSSNGIIVRRGELVFDGADATTTWSGTNKVLLAEDATLRVKGGMTLSVGELAAYTDNTYGDIALEDASRLTLTAGGTKTINNAIESEGATLSATGQNAVMTVTDLTLKGTEANAAANTTLSGGTWVLEQGAVTWDTAATGALVVAANTTVKVNDDTMKKLTVNAANAVLATAKADGSAAELSVESINVGYGAQGGRVENVNLTLTGTGSFIRGTVAGVTVNQAADATTGVVDMTTPALKFGSGTYDTSNRATLDSLTILSGKVEVPALNFPVNVLSGEVVVNGANALLDLGGGNRLCKAGNDSAPAADILMHAGGLDRAAGYSGQITIDDKGTAQTMKLFRVGSNAAASILLKDIETTTGVTTLTDVYRVKLADGSAFELTQNLAEGAGNLLFDFADDAPADASVSAASGATVSIGVGGVLGDVLDAGSVSYTIADKSIAPLASAVAWDATLALYNISASFGTDGKLTLSATDVPLSADDVYRSSEDNIDDGTQWAGNGTTVYADAPYASVYIDSATEIDLTQAAAGAGDGLVLSNLIGRGAGADLSIVGDGNDKVTINNNLEPADLGDEVKVNMLSFNGDITVTDTTLQLLNTVATPGAEGAGELDTESVYQMNGALKTDANSLVELSSGILKLNGKGAKSSELLGGVLVANGKGMLQVSGDAAVGGNLDITISDSDVEDAVPDAELVSGGKLTLLDGAAVMSGFDIHGQGKGKETLSIAKDAAVMLESYSSVMDTVLELQEGSELTWVGTQAPDAAIVELDGLTGSGAIVNIVDQGGQPDADIVIEPQGNSTFSGDLSRYEGYVSVLKSEGTQTLDKVTTADAAASKLDLYNNGNLNINVAQEGGNKTLNVREFALAKDSATTIEMNVGSDAPALTIGGVATITDEAEVTLSSNSAEVLAAGDRLLLATAVGTGAVGNLDGVSISLDTTDDAFRRLSESATLSVVGKEVLVNLSAAETNRYADAVSDENALAGAELLWPVNPGELGKDSALKAADQAVADLLKAGNKAEAERVLAAVAGSSTAVLGSAFSADVERQLRAIRNRTTTMGVGQCEVNEGMPYVNAWINAEGDHRELSADGLAAGYTLDSWGGTVGFDMDLTPNLTMGLAVTAMYGDIDADAPDRAEGDFDTQYVSLFARVAHQAWVHTFVATVGRADASLNRTVSYGNGAYKTTGDTDGMGYGLMYEVARTFALSEDGSTCWQPVFNVAWRHSALDAYTEKGGDAALEVGEQEMNVLTLGIGARLQSVVGENIYNRASVFEARALVKFDAGDRQGEADVALIGGANSATVKAAEVGAVGVEVGAGLTIPMGMQSGSVFIDGSAELRSGYTNFNGTVGYRFNF